jgi:hypothetical protein
MLLEIELETILKTKCPRVFPTTAPGSTATPYVVWQHIGGTSFRFFDNTPGDKRNAHIQINVWHRSTEGAFALMRAIEDALCAATDKLIVNPLGEPIDGYDDSNELRGALQSFSVWGSR